MMTIQTRKDYRLYLAGRICDRVNQIIAGLDRFEANRLAMLAHRLDTIAAAAERKHSIEKPLVNIKIRLEQAARRGEPHAFAHWRNRLVKLYAGDNWRNRYGETEALRFVPPVLLRYISRLEARFNPKPDYRSNWEKLLDYYGHRCLCCGLHESETPEGCLTKDHIKPRSKGGKLKPANLQPLCQACNVAKANQTIDYRPTVPDWLK